MMRGWLKLDKNNKREIEKRLDILKVVVQSNNRKINDLSSEQKLYKTQNEDYIKEIEKLKQQLIVLEHYK